MLIGDSVLMCDLKFSAPVYYTIPTASFSRSLSDSAICREFTQEN